MEKYDTYQFIHDISKQLKHEHFVLETQIDFESLKNVCLTDFVKNDPTTREHILISIFVLVSDYIPWDDDELNKKYILCMSHITGKGYGTSLEQEKHVQGFFNYKYKKLKKPDLAKLLYQTYLAFLADEHAEFHRCFHYLALVTLLIIEIYLKHGKNEALLYMKSIDLFLEKVTPVAVIELDYNEPFLMNLATLSKEKKHYSFVTNHMEEIWKNLAFITTVYHKHKKTQSNWEYYHIFKPKAVEDSEYEDNLYPFYYDSESNKLYYVPYILLNDNIIRDLLRIYVENQLNGQEFPKKTTVLKGLKGFEIKLLI